jgi:hypothetical protein
MGYDTWDAQNDAAWEEMHERLAEELYPEHKDKAIEEFTQERLCSYYKEHSMVMRPAIDMATEANSLRAGGHYTAAVVFYASAIELLLKATVLQPVIVGLIHNENLADVVVAHTLAGTGFSRYTKLLSHLFEELALIELSEVRRAGAKKPLLEECAELQTLRNTAIHGGKMRTQQEANFAKTLTSAVFHELVEPLLHVLDLTVVKRGEIRELEQAKVQEDLPLSM